MRFIISRNRSQIVKKSLIDTPAKSNSSEYNRTNLRISILLIIEYKIEHILNDLYYSNIKGRQLCIIIRSETRLINICNYAYQLIHPCC